MTTEAPPKRADFAIYLAAKLMRFERRLVRPPNPEPAGGATGNVEPGFSARQLFHYLCPPRQSGPPKPRFAEVYQVSSYFVRNRLAALDREGLLKPVGRAFRGAHRYAWTRPIHPVSQAAYDSIEAEAPGRHSFAWDCFRIIEAFGNRPFAAEEFVGVYRRRREEWMARETFRIATETAAQSVEYGLFLRQRLDDLRRAGLVSGAGETGALSEQGFRLGRRFQIFAHGEWTSR